MTEIERFLTLMHQVEATVTLILGRKTWVSALVWDPFQMRWKVRIGQGTKSGRSSKGWLSIYPGSRRFEVEWD